MHATINSWAHVHVERALALARIPPLTSLLAPKSANVTLPPHTPSLLLISFLPTTDIDLESGSCTELVYSDGTNAPMLSLGLFLLPNPQTASSAPFRS